MLTMNKRMKAFPMSITCVDMYILEVSFWTMLFIVTWQQNLKGNTFVDFNLIHLNTSVDFKLIHLIFLIWILMNVLVTWSNINLILNKISFSAVVLYNPGF